MTTKETTTNRAKEPAMPGTVVGTGADWWHRPTNKYCDCPPSRYDPRHPRPTNPECEEHGEPK
jgi:hypothetical protein